MMNHNLPQLRNVEKWERQGINPLTFRKRLNEKNSCKCFSKTASFFLTEHFKYLSYIWNKPVWILYNAVSLSNRRPLFSISERQSVVFFKAWPRLCSVLNHMFIIIAVITKINDVILLIGVSEQKRSACLESKVKQHILLFNIYYNICSWEIKVRL